MYLKASRYVSGWEFSAPAEQARYAKLVEIAELTKEQLDPGSPSGYIELTVGYWRKANAVHQWFVDHVQDKLDRCEKHDVKREELLALKAACQEVLLSAHPEHKTIDSAKAATVLPTQSGFFFGGTEYDEWYVRDLEDTIAIIDRVLGLPEVWHFTYQSSW
jgi:hypothetical protein